MIGPAEQFSSGTETLGKAFILPSRNCPGGCSNSHGTTGGAPPRGCRADQAADRRTKTQVSLVGCGDLATTYLGDRSGEHDHLVEFAHSLHESVYTWPFDHVDVVVLSFNFHGDGKVGLVQGLTVVSVTVKVDASVGSL